MASQFQNKRIDSLLDSPSLNLIEIGDCGLISTPQTMFDSMFCQLARRVVVQSSKARNKSSSALDSWARRGGLRLLWQKLVMDWRGGSWVGHYYGIPIFEYFASVHLQSIESIGFGERGTLE
jgi:hypothetical protein